MTTYDLPEGFGFLVSQKALLKNREGKYLFLLSSKRMNIQEHWGLPGGLLEQGEMLEAGLRREVLEETGLEIEIGRPLANCMFDMDFEFSSGIKINASIINLIYECETNGDTVQLSEEHDEYKWMTENEICMLDPKQNVNSEKVINYFKSLGFPKK